MDYRVHRYRSADGRLELAARDYPAARADAPVLLMMHGLTRNSADFEPLAARLAGRYRMIVPDQRGRGLSQWDADPAQYRPDVYAQDMLALVDDLGITRAALVGTSMGGLMALAMNALRPGLAQAAIFNDIGPVLEPSGLARIQGYVGPAGAMADWTAAAARTRAINAPAFPDYGGAQWDAFARRIARANADGTVSFSYDPAIAQGLAGDDPEAVPPDLWPLWDLFDAVPVLVVRGALSDLLSAATVAEMARRHAGPYASVEVPRVGHAPMLDEPAALAAIEAFLAEHAGRGA
ncbi:alpha/beta fold hydrolase [Novosphingobium sp. AP12]|uniref:alpha/beta fold hydrolase n=1 Tax=Novosphingobium sp. AP12 TaxID=1144305 RepID=UPI000272249B|nr:alpha/beta hydrolase [Novosphingobium sp. AP12]EJL20738.1 putative hydrolase or acyltransferase of alpha/beta superfamily [Novosphingobium sp. AP12]